MFSIKQIYLEGPLSKVQPALFNLFSKRAPSALEAFYDGPILYMDPTIVIFEPRSIASTLPNAFYNFKNNKIYINAKTLSLNANSIVDIQKSLNKISDVLWHEYVHYLQYAHKIVQNFKTWKFYLYQLKSIFLDKKKMYDSLAIEQHAHIEQIKYLKEVKGLSYEEILEYKLELMLWLKFKKTSLFSKEDTKKMSKFIIQSNKAAFLAFLRTHYTTTFDISSSLNTKVLDILIKGIGSPVFNSAVKSISSWKKYYKNLDYKVRNEALDWDKGLILKAARIRLDRITKQIS